MIKKEVGFTVTEEYGIWIEDIKQSLPTIEEIEKELSNLKYIKELLCL